MQKQSNTTATKSAKPTAPVKKTIAAKPEAPKPTNVVAQPKDPAKRKTDPNTITFRARKLIAEGATRDEVWDALKEDLGLERRWYVNWYFAEAKRKGMDISKAGKLTKLPTDQA